MYRLTYEVTDIQNNQTTDNRTICTQKHTSKTICEIILLSYHCCNELSVFTPQIKQ